MMKHSDSELRRIERTLGVDFADIGLLERAFVHDSFVAEFPGVFEESNERLEFLGDAVLDLVIAEELTRRFPERPEGALTQMRASLVDKDALAGVGRRLGLGEWLVMGKGEAEIGGAERDSNLEDAFEALLGALFLDGGYEAARGFALGRCRRNWRRLRTWGVRRGTRSRCCMRRRWSGVSRRRCMRKWDGRGRITRRRSWRGLWWTGGRWV